MTSSAPVHLDAIGQIAVPVQDVDRASAFYRDVLGMTFLFSAPPGLAFFDCGGVRLMLSRPEKPEFDHPASIIYYKVVDVPAVYKAIVAKGAASEHEPGLVHRTEDTELWMAFVRDSEGNVLGLMEERSPGA